jgi:hypothetical protein
MPRSGTKLLRDLLNQHELISIPDVESHFIPAMVNEFGETLKITTQKEKESFFNFFASTSFYFNNVNKGRLLTKHDFISQCDFSSWNTLFRFIAIHYSKNKNLPEVIWGDKTPRYLRSVKLLKRIFPRAKFIHIIRDPRDYCLSLRKTWNKNIYRAAENWNTVMGKAMEYPAALGSDYIEVSYEQLTLQPEQVLTKICDFLGIRFTQEMLTVKQSHEFHGDAKSSREIILNSKKYLNQLTDQEVEKIESLSLPALTHFGYELLHQVSPSKLSVNAGLLYKVNDIWHMYRFYIREFGVARATSYFLKLKKNNAGQADN